MEKAMKQPDWTRPSNIAKARKAIGFVNAVLNGTNPNPLPQKYLDKNLGRIDTPLGHWLRYYLLIEVNNGYYNPYDNVCKQYIQNKRGIQRLREIIGIKKEQPIPYAQTKEWIDDKFKNEIETGNFVYETKSHRDWHDLQFIPSKKRSVLFAINGMPHEYDISAAAPNILYQLHKTVPLKTGPRGGYISGYRGIELPVVEKYLENKKEFREFIRKEFGISYDMAKTIINALFNGARRNTQSKLFDEIGRNKILMHRLQKYVLFNKLVEEVSEIWRVLAALHPERYNKDGDKQKLDAKQRYEIYFEREHQIIEVVRNYCRDKGIRVFTIHDGYITSDEIDVVDLQSEILKQTGFDLLLEYEYCGDMK